MISGGKTFTVRSSYASAVLRIIILSIRLSVTRVHSDEVKEHTADISHERAIALHRESKNPTLSSVHDFAKCLPIFNILSPLDLFISSGLWLQHPDLNPINYKMCIKL